MQQPDLFSSTKTFSFFGLLIGHESNFSWRDIGELAIFGLSRILEIVDAESEKGLPMMRSLRIVIVLEIQTTS